MSRSNEGLPPVMIAILAVVVLVLAAGGAWLYRAQERAARQKAEASLFSIARLKAAQIEAWRSERISNAAELTESPFLAEAVARYRGNPDDANAAELRARFRSLATHYHYDDVMLVDPQGRVPLSLGGHHEASSADSTILAAALRDHAPVLGEPHAEGQAGVPHVDAVAPLFAGGRPLGAIMLVADLTQFLYPMLQSWPVPSETAETLLVKRDGEDALFLNDLRHQPDTALKLRIPLTRTDVPAVMAVLGREGVVQGRDYRGIDVVAVILRIPGSPWYIVAKEDAAEIYAEWRLRGVLLLAVLAALVGIVCVAWLLLSQRNARAHYLALYRAESRLRESMESHSVTLRSIGDGVISTDTLGRVQLLNPVAEALTGWTAAEARGRPLEEVFRIVGEETREKVESPAASTLRDGQVTGLAHHTLLLSRDGREIPIADSTAPIRDGTGAIAGAVLVFRDQSEDRRLQRIMQARVVLLEYAPDHCLEELLTRALEEIGALVQSPIGYYHFVDADRLSPSLRQWASRTRAEFSRAEVTRELAIPVVREGRTVAILGLGNKPADYTEKDAETVAFLADVTWFIVEHKRTEEELRDSGKKFRDLFNNAEVGMFRTRLDGSEILDSNERYLRILGRAREEVQGHSSVVHWADPREREEMVRQLQAHGRVVEMECGMLNKRGEVRRCLTSLRLYREQGILEGSILDITERKQAEDALRESEQRYRSLVEQLNLGVFLSTVGGKLEHVNAQLIRMGGYPTLEEYLAVPAPSMYKDPQDRARLLAILAEKGQVRNFETVFLRKDGTPYPAALGAVLFRDAAGAPTRLLGTVEDITERKRAEAERARLEAELQQAQKMDSVGRLAGGVAHDFNNMLGVIIGHSEMALEQVSSTQPLFADLEAIRAAAERSARLTRQLLAFARRQTVAPKVLDPNATIAGMLSMLQRLIGEDIDLAWRPGAGVWPIRMDPSQIDQILANLCVNARDAIDGVGKVIIETDNRAYDDDFCAHHPGFVAGEYVLLGVSDDGCGMDQAALSHLFEPFYTTKETGKGTGLGLSTVYGIVKQNNGFINVSSEPNRGTTIGIHLPRYEGEAVEVPREAPAEIRPDRSATILLLEDEPSIMRMASAMLGRLGYRVLAVGSPGEAIRLAGEHPGDIDLLITDVVMPEMNGRQLAVRVRARRPKLKCLFMSGYTADVIAHRGILEDGVQFIQKPFSLKTLGAKVRETLDGR